MKYFPHSRLTKALNIFKYIYNLKFDFHYEIKKKRRYSNSKWYFINKKKLLYNLNTNNINEELFSIIHNCSCSNGITISSNLSSQNFSTKILERNQVHWRYLITTSSLLRYFVSVKLSRQNLEEFSRIYERPVINSIKLTRPHVCAPLRLFMTRTKGCPRISGR